MRISNVGSQQWVTHNDGLAMSYGNPANSKNANSRTQLVRNHLTMMSKGVNISLDATLPVIPCPTSTAR
jgi:hypothetical protein